MVGGGGGSVGIDYGMGYGMGFDANIIDYNGVNLAQNYKNAQGITVPVNAKMLASFKFIIDNPTYRSLISAYLAPNANKLTIKFDATLGDTGGTFDKATNTIYINPDQLAQIGMLDMVNILVHESLHAMFFQPTATIQSQLATAQATLATHYSNPPATENMIHHEAMGQYYKSQSIAILRDFHNSTHGVVQNATPINDTHFEAVFLFSLLQVQYNGTSTYMWITQFHGRSTAIQDWLGVKWDEIREIYKNNP
jgi:hypothetical protein